MKEEQRDKRGGVTFSLCGWFSMRMDKEKRLCYSYTIPMGTATVGRAYTRQTYFLEDRIRAVAKATSQTRTAIASITGHNSRSITTTVASATVARNARKHIRIAPAFLTASAISFGDCWLL